MPIPIILAIDTSLDETSVAITQGRKILTNVVFSQITYHPKYRGVMPALAKRLHQEKLPMVIEKALKNVRLSPEKIDVFAVTQGPGQAIALEVGISMAKNLAVKYRKPLIGVNHMVGHIYSAFCQNRNGLPKKGFFSPYLCLTISGGHTQLVLFKNHLEFELLGETLDDAVGEALDKAARMLGFGYPGGPIIERLAELGNTDRYPFSVPMIYKSGLDFSYSGIKTAMLYKIQKMGKLTRQDTIDLAASFQQAIIESLALKIKRALKQYPKINRLVVVGGVASNRKIRRMLRSKFKNCQVFFPALPSVFTDNAAMVGVAAYYYLIKNRLADIKSLERQPNLNF